MTDPLVSIITPSLNQRAFIRETIDSVLGQDYPSIEYIVADGGSTDGTVDLLQAMDRRVRWTSAPDNGQAGAINSAVAGSSGRYLAWLNSDDVYTQGAIAAMVEFLEARPDMAMVYGHADNMDQDGGSVRPAKQVERFSMRRLRDEVDFIVQPATLIRRDAFVEVGGLDASLIWAFDYDLWLRLAAAYPIGFLDRVLARVRIHRAAKTASGGLARLEEIERMARAHGRRSIQSGFAGSMGAAQLVASVAALRRREVRAGSVLCAEAIRHLTAYGAYRIKRLPRLTRFDTAPRPRAHQL